MSRISIYAVVILKDDKVTCAPRLYKTKAKAYRRGVDEFLKGCEKVIVVDALWGDVDDVFVCLEDLADKISKYK